MAAASGTSSETPSVLQIASEALPFAKTGGLADVLGALPRALARLGWSVTVLIPRYRGAAAGTLIDRFPLTVGGHLFDVELSEAPLGNGARALLVDVPSLFDRDGLYYDTSGDYPDNPRRFAVLVRAALDHAARSRVRPTIVHAHDWQAGLAPVYLKTLYSTDPVLANVPTMFTIHNLAYAGSFEPDWLPRLDLPWSLYTMEGLEFYGRIPFLKAGIVYSETLTTVSPHYAQEIQTPEAGCGFDGILRQRSADLSGVLNGIDVDVWDPATDPFLPKPYRAGSLDGKRAAKEAVLKQYGLPADAAAMRRPLIGMISRMVDQKGLDLIAQAGDELLALDAAFVVLGTGEARYQDMWRQFAVQRPARVGVHIGFSEELAHLIEAGADMFLMPSLYEPCGLNQMYSLRYGTLPVVRYVGGLADTVADDVTGFSFAEYSAEALLEALGRAITAFADGERWQAMQAAGMREDHSWDHSAREYVKIYERVAGLS
jgi:starch synthase